jgi:hypothetical protein
MFVNRMEADAPHGLGTGMEQDLPRKGSRMRTAMRNVRFFLPKAAFQINHRMMDAWDSTDGWTDASGVARANARPTV